MISFTELQIVQILCILNTVKEVISQNVAIAQLVLEHLSDTQKVGGSSPPSNTNAVVVQLVE